MRKLTDAQLADLLAMLGIVNKHFEDSTHPSYSLMPMSKMAYFSSEIVRMVHIADAIETLALEHSINITVAKLPNSLYQCSISDTLVITDPDLSRAKIEACALYLEGKLLPCTPTS